MKIVIAPDSFKESLTAAQAAAAMSAGVREVYPDAECVEVPLADGGEGTTEVLVGATGGRLIPVECADALGRPRTGQIGVDATGTGFVEVASAVGLADIEPGLRDPWRATSRGVATLVLAALDAGVRHLVVGLGGSATNDGGAGLLVGLGAVLRDAAGREVAPAPRELARVAEVDLAGLDPRLGELSITLACDVTNPLLGSEGATAIFGPQKGLSLAEVPKLDAAVANWATALESAFGRSVRTEPGAGAAGGLGVAFLALGARRRPGIEVVLELVGFADQLADADLVLAGEGSVDAQTLSGKAPAGVARLARQHGVPVILFAGRVAPDSQVLLRHGVSAVVPITHRAGPLTELLAQGSANLQQATATALRLYQLGERRAAP